MDDTWMPLVHHDEPGNKAIDAARTAENMIRSSADRRAGTIESTLRRIW
jgi:hypothetical protein